MVASFVQGRLRNEDLDVTIESRCAQSGRALRLRVDSEMTIDVQEGGPEPMVFEPQVDWGVFDEPSILHAY